ncbi:MAG: hypothetical protein RR922_07275 [Clostridia bacterium]
MKNIQRKIVLIYNIPIEKQLNILKVLNNIRILDDESGEYFSLLPIEREKEICIDDYFHIGILNLTDIAVEDINNIFSVDISQMFCIYTSASDNAEYIKEKANKQYVEDIQNVDNIRDCISINLRERGYKFLVNEESIGKVNID